MYSPRASAPLRCISPDRWMELPEPGEQAVVEHARTLERLDVITLMNNTALMTQALRRSTIYLDPELHRALRIKAAETDRSVSDLISDAVKLALAEDAEDLQAFEERASEPDLLFETVVKALKADGKI